MTLSLHWRLCTFFVVSRSGASRYTISKNTYNPDRFVTKLQIQAANDRIFNIRIGPDRIIPSLENGDVEISGDRLSIDLSQER